MGWLSRLLGRHSPPEVPREHDFGGAIGKLPMMPSPQFIRLYVFADGRIELEGRAVQLQDLEAGLRSAYQPGAVVFYSRENPGEDSTVAPAVINCVCRLGLPLAFPSEATPTLNHVLEERGTAS